MSDIDVLRRRLEDTFGARRKPSGPWSAAVQPMTAQLQKVRQAFGSRHRNEVGRDAMARATAIYRQTGRVAGFMDLRYVCLGAGYVADDGYCLLGEAPLREKLLALAGTAPGRQNRLKLFQSLLRAYWVFPLHRQETPHNAHAGWSALREWLAQQHADIKHQPSRKPAWFSMLDAHANLLSDAPCADYAQALLAGNATQLQRAIDALQIPDEAWVQEEAVLAQLRAATAGPDDDLRAMLPRLMEIAAGQAGIAVTAVLAQRGMAMLLARWARCQDYAPHTELFIAALDLLGTPWAHRAVWDSCVLDENGGACPTAREMVGAWLKDCLIDGFFRYQPGNEAMAALWKKYAVFISAMWVGTGATAAADDRFSCCARQCQLVLPGRQPTALMMKFGTHLVVVRGMAGAQTDVFRWADVGAEWAARLASGSRVELDLAKMTQHTPLAARLDTQDTARIEAKIRGILLRGM